MSTETRTTAARTAEEKEMENQSEKPSGRDSSVSRSEEGAIETARAAPQPQGNELEKAVSANDISSIPNGGVVAWLQVLGSFLLFMNSWWVRNMPVGFSRGARGLLRPDSTARWHKASEPPADSSQGHREHLWRLSDTLQH